jgi:hypothetical protein
MTDNEDIYRKHCEELVRFATGLVGPFDAHDVVTEACLRAFQSRSWESGSLGTRRVPDFWDQERLRSLVPCSPSRRRVPPFSPA